MSPSDAGREDRSEELESVPWQHLVTTPPTDRRRHLVIAAVLVVIAAISASAARTLWPVDPSDPGPLTGSAVTQPVVEAPTIPPEPTPAPQPMVLSEADLMAVDPEDLRSSAAAHAEWYVAEWLTVEPPADADAPEPTGRSFVESVIAVEVTDLAPSRHRVVVVVRSLSALGEAPYQRIPPRAFAVVVDQGDRGPLIADLPTPAALPELTTADFDLEPGKPPDSVVEAARAVASHAGSVVDSSIDAARVDDRWRVEMSVRDRAGVPITTVVWVASDGSLADPPQESK